MHTLDTMSVILCKAFESMKANTHKPPSENTTNTPILPRRDILSRAIVDIGKLRIMISETRFKAAVAI